jgi:hypothetical protein
VEEQGTISLYLDLKEGEKADLEVVARASLAWAATLREMATILDPFSEVRIELASGTPGSLSLNGVIKHLRGALPSKTHSRALILAALLWMADKTADWGWQKVLDRLTTKHPEATKHLTKAEAEDLAKQIAAALQPTVAEQPKRQLFRELERDPVIVGVGATEKPSRRPEVIVPRSEFRERAGDAVDEDGNLERKRTVTTTVRVVLVSPVLKDAERSWRFQPAGLAEFGAKMKDHDFLEAFRLGRIAVPMKPGVEMTIEVQSKEELIGGSWVVQERSVSRVLSPAPPSDSLLPPE